MQMKDIIASLSARNSRAYIQSLVLASFCIGIDPSTGSNGRPILGGKVFRLVVDHEMRHFFVQFVQIVKGNHGIGMMFGMKVGIPQQDAYQEVGTYRAGVAQTVGCLGDFAVGVFQIANKIDHGVAQEDGCEPPDGQALERDLKVSHGIRNGGIGCHLSQGKALQLLLGDGFQLPVLDIPPPAGIVHGDAKSRVDETSHAAGKGKVDIPEHAKECRAILRNDSKIGVLQLFLGVEGSELWILVDIVGAVVGGVSFKVQRNLFTYKM